MELGKAYVQIMPSAKGISGSISKQFDPEAKSAGESSGKSLGSSLVSTLKKLIVAAGIGKMIASAINMGGELEQNLGGTEAVFGQFANSIKESASDAYKNMGLSASDYMATANKMGSLFQGSGMEQQKSLDLTSAAMQRAADVASVMGVDTSMAMESIAGAAKSNFTMMDNLGVAMNATTIQAYALEKGINFDWKTASNAEKSEVAMKMFMDRTSQYAGNFARESEETFSGSLGAVKASFQDVLATISTGGDWGHAFDGMSKSLVNFTNNLMPMLSSTIGDLPLMLSTLIRDTGPKLTTSFMTMLTDIGNRIGGTLPDIMVRLTEGFLGIISSIGDNLPGLIEAASNILTGLASGITAALPILIQQVPIILQKLITALLEGIPILIDAGVQLLTSLVTAVPQVVPVIVAAIPVIIDGILTAIIDNLPTIIKAGMDLFASLIDALPEIITAIVAVLPVIIDSIVSASNQLIPLIIDAGIDLLTSLVDALPVIIETIVKVLPTIIDSIIKGTLSNIPLIIDAGLELLSALVGALPEIILAIVSALPDIIDSVCSAVIDNIPLIVAAGVSLFTGLIGDLPLIIAELVEAMPKIIDGIIKALGEGWKSFKDMGGQLLGGLADGISDAIGGVVKKAKEAAAKIVGTVKDFFGIRSPSKVFYGFGEQLDAGLANGITGNMKPISKAMDEVGALTTRSFESEIAMNASSMGAGQLQSAAMASQSSAIYNFYLSGGVPVADSDKRKLAQYMEESRFQGGADT